MKGLPMTYNRDMQEDKEPLFDAAAQLAASLEMMATVVDSTDLHQGKPLQAAVQAGPSSPRAKHKMRVGCQRGPTNAVMLEIFTDKGVGTVVAL